MRHERVAEDRVCCAPTPIWVDHQPYRRQISETDISCIANGICRLLNDVHVDLSGTELAWHSRTAQRVLTREGAERAAHFVAEFDPENQRLEVHFIRVLRGDEIFEHATRDAFQLLRRETSLERLTFDGRLTASLLIPDVRADDIVEISFTLYGGNPVLGGRYAAWAVFDSFNPWFESRHRMIRPFARNIHAKAFNSPPEPDLTISNGVEDSRWHVVGQKRREVEELTPPWLVLESAVQFSEFESWNDVARLFEPFYESPAIPEALAEQIDRLAAAHNGSEERAAEWLRFVQSNLRYFALSLGEGGLMPRDLEAIWNTRFGDCKDAAKLYIAGARRLGLDACAALVSTSHGMALDGFIPSPGVFNHCIVRVNLNGISYWLDPIATNQSGKLAEVYQPHIGWALPLTSDIARLERLADPVPLHVIHFEDEVRVGSKRASPAQLSRHIDYYFWAADLFRSRIANQGAADYARIMLTELKSVWPSIEETKPIEIREDPHQNRVTLIASYEIRDAWKSSDDGKGLIFAVHDNSMNLELAATRGTSRQVELFMGRPRKITRYLQMTMPRSWSGAGWHYLEETADLSYADRLRMDGKTIVNTKDLVIGAWSLPAADTEAYDKIVRRTRENLLFIKGIERFGRIRPKISKWGLLIRGGVSTIWLLYLAWLILALGRSAIHP